MKMPVTDYDRLVRGNLVTPSGRIENGWIAIAKSSMAAIGIGEAPAASETKDFGKCWILPGAIDGQTHAGSYRGLPGAIRRPQKLSPAGIADTRRLIARQERRLAEIG